MANIDKRLYVRDVVRDKFGEIVVVGIPDNGKPIKIGDSFNLRYELSQEDILNNVQDPVQLNSVAVSLSVSKIDVLHQEVTELGHGLTGGLYLVGTGLEFVSPKCFLGT